MVYSANWGLYITYHLLREPGNSIDIISPKDGPVLVPEFGGTAPHQAVWRVGISTLHRPYPYCLTIGMSTVFFFWLSFLFFLLTFWMCTELEKSLQIQPWDLVQLMMILLVTRHFGSPGFLGICSNSIIFYFHPDPWGFLIQFDLRIFFRWVGLKPPSRFASEVLWKCMLKFPRLFRFSESGFAHQFLGVFPVLVSMVCYRNPRSRTKHVFSVILVVTFSSWEVFFCLNWTNPFACTLR